MDSGRGWKEKQGKRWKANQWVGLGPVTSPNRLGRQFFSWCILGYALYV